ncbi:MAG: ABC transporter substrate-binding protein [Clostridia bacterium]|nr:ABC transporter substrate-binding protein [Clostridia bacterium]
MKSISKILALLLAVLMCVAVFASCNQNTPKDTGAETGTGPAPAPAGDKTLVVGYSPFSSKFSPFFSETAYDQDAYAMTQLGLLTSDRTGAIILKGIEGETKEYNGTDYTYYGPADLTITENEDGTVYYDFKLRDDLKFSDGEKLTVDDVIFSMYVLCDPMYDGSSTLFAQPIEGMEEYRSGVESLYDLIVAAGRDNDKFDNWDEDAQTKFWEASDKAFKGLAQDIVDYCVAAGAADEGNIAAAAGAWGFELEEGATVDDFAALLAESYENDIVAAVGTEQANLGMDDLFPDYTDYTQTPVKTGDSAANITGIQKIDDYNLRVVMTEIDATAIYQLGISIAPLHYYGETDKYDYENNKFGFEKGDLSHVRSVTTQPMGAGPYKFIKFENGVINYEANENYYLGAPKTKYVNFQQCMKDDDKISGVTTGTIDITDPSFSTDTIETIKAANSNKELEGDKVYTNTVDNLGYGYIGMCAKVMNVGGDPASDASKALRKAFGTIFSVYRDVAIDTYYGDRASVINYPISNTSWAAPRSTDDGYKVAFSVDVEGNDIYTSDMSAEDKYEAAKKAALGFFEAAGYTVEDGKVTAAPEGASLEYQAWIPADGIGDHPAFQIFTEAQKALEEIGIKLDVKDLTDSSELWTALRAQSVAIWAAAWGATVDPDMYQIYFSGDDTREAGGSNYQYAIDDKELNQIILDARKTTDQAARKLMYKEALDIIIDWAVEIPTYQRQNAIIFSAERVNLDTITPDITTFYGWMAEIQNLELK